MYVEKCPESSMQDKKILGIINASARILRIVNVCGKNARSRQCRARECSETIMYVEKVLGIIKGEKMLGNDKVY